MGSELVDPDRRPPADLLPGGGKRVQTDSMSGAEQEEVPVFI